MTFSGHKSLRISHTWWALVKKEINLWVTYIQSSDYKLLKKGFCHIQLTELLKISQVHEILPCSTACLNNCNVSN